MVEEGVIPLADAEAAAASNEKDAEARLRLSQLYLRAGRDYEALDQGLWVTKLDPKKAQGWKVLGDAQMATKHYKAGLSAYRKASELDPDDLAMADLIEAAQAKLIKTQQQKYSSETL